MKRGLSDEEVRAEIERLRKSEDVKRTQAEINSRQKKERKRLYQLRWLEKRGQKLATEGAGIA